MEADKCRPVIRYSLMLVLLSISMLSSSQELTDMVYYGKESFLLEGTEIADSLKENRYDRLPLSYK